MIAYAVKSIQDFFQAGFHMYPILIVMAVGIIIQLAKVVIDIFRYKRFYIGHIFSSGGFPSFHSGLASSVTMIVRLHEGFGSITFALAFAFSVLFAYDAMNLRFEAGQHAHYINDLRFELQGVLQKKEGPLKERIGHTPREVVGGVVVGSILTYILYYRFYIA
ncbi:MAG: divergent PAP2 family protein [candidate division SR1 bacterium]|nr:divergent PAP2 family protein [candidate division SR1 bacterium]